MAKTLMEVFMKEHKVEAVQSKIQIYVSWKCPGCYEFFNDLLKNINTQHILTCHKCGTKFIVIQPKLEWP